MAQATDIVLNNAGYMVQPGTPTNPGYKRLQDGYPEGLTQRTSLTDFFGGQQRALQLERDTFYTSTAVGPALGGQGVTPWPHISDAGWANLFDGQLPDLDTYIPSVIVRDTIYYAVGTRLYSRTTSGTGPPGSGLVKDYPHVITDLTIYNSSGLLIAFGSATDILFRASSGTEVALFTGDRAHRITAYAGYALWIDARTASSPTVIRMVTGGGVQFRHVNYDATDILTVDGQVLLVTKQALYTMSGRVRDVMIPNPGYDPDNPSSAGPTMPGQEWTGDFEPFFQQGVYNNPDDFKFIAGYGGRTIAWIAGGVHELVPSGDRAGWRSTGLEGKRCFGGCIAAGYAIVSIESHSGLNELWAYNGNGWWRIAHKPIPADDQDVWCWPLNIGQSTSAGQNVIIFQHNNTVATWLRLTPYRTNRIHPDAAEFVTPMIDAGDRDKIKAWRKIGAVFASPELHGNITSVDSTAVYLDYSTDAGETWTTADHRTTSGTNPTGGGGNSLQGMNFDMEAVLQGVTSRFIMLRVRWGSIHDWAPILTGVWIEHEALSSPARRRKWQLRIHARDQEIDRDGTTLTRTGRQLIEELWTAWENDQPLTFRDIDYDTDPTERTVRIVGISEAATQPFDHGEWGDSTITLNLVEV